MYNILLIAADRLHTPLPFCTFQTLFGKKTLKSYLAKNNFSLVWLLSTKKEYKCQIVATEHFQKTMVFKPKLILKFLEFYFN